MLLDSITAGRLRCSHLLTNQRTIRTLPHGRARILLLRRLIKAVPIPTQHQPRMVRNPATALLINNPDRRDLRTVGPQTITQPTDQGTNQDIYYKHNQDIHHKRNRDIHQDINQDISSNRPHQALGTVHRVGQELAFHILILIRQHIHRYTHINHQGRYIS